LSPASTAEELARFEHPRMPLIEPPLFSSDLVPITEPAPDERQTRLI